MICTVYIMQHPPMFIHRCHLPEASIENFRCDGTVVHYLDWFGKYQENTKWDGWSNNRITHLVFSDKSSERKVYSQGEGSIITIEW